MIEFYQGTQDSVIKRLCKTIFSFDKSWLQKCTPAPENKINQINEIVANHGYFLPKLYIDYLKVLGENDGGLLENEYDGFMEPNIDTIIDLFLDTDFDAIDYLNQGLFLFSYHWTESHCFFRLKMGDDNPLVTDYNNHYFAENFEKYLFQKAFVLFREKFEHKSSVGTSIITCDKLLKQYSFPCSICGGTSEEQMAFVLWLVKSLELDEKPTWFSDKLNYCCYNEHYALHINLYYSILIVFSCDSIALKNKVDCILKSIFDKVTS